MDTLFSPPLQPRKERPICFLGKKRAYQGTGRRKSAVARVFLTEGRGVVTINGRTLENYFSEEKDRSAVINPLAVCDLLNRVDVTVHVHGGGISGQSGAICQGVARAIKVMFGLDKVKAPAPPAPPMEGEVPGEKPMAPVATPADEPMVTMGLKLRKSGFLTRDSRMKERKKYGRKGARKAFQFSKR